MSLTQFPNGLSSFGMPQIGGGNMVPQSTGTYFFVDSGSGSSSNDGLDSDHPLATIDQAVNKCTADKGDVIIVMAGHAENLDAATDLVLDVGGVTVVGLGNGHNRPTLTFNGTGGNIPISGTNISVRNIVFMAGVSAVTNGINMTGNGNEIIGCEFDFATTTGFDFVDMLLINTADDCKIIGNKFIAEAGAAGCESCIQITDAQKLVIMYNWFEGAVNTAMIEGVTTASTHQYILYNVFHNTDATPGMLLDAHDNSTGLLAGNAMSTIYTTNLTTCFDPGDLWSVQNYLCNDEDEYGVIVPATTPT